MMSQSPIKMMVKQASTQESSVQTLRKYVVVFGTRDGRVSTGVPGNPWHRTMLDPNESEGLLRRSRHDAAKGSSVAMSATELARRVCRK